MTTVRTRRRPVAWGARGFPRLTAAWVFTNLGDSALFLMMAVWVKEMTGSDVAAGFVFVALGLPALMAPFIGMLADRVSRKRLLVANNVAFIPIVLSLLLVTDANGVWLVYVVIFLYSAGGYVTSAAQSGILRAMLRDDQLASGNGVLSTIDNGLRLVSPLIGTALYVWIGPWAVVCVTAACFAASAIILAGLPVEAPRPERVAGGGYLRELLAGFAQLLRVRPLMLMTIAIAIAFGATGLLNVIVFPLLDAMNADPAAIGWLVPLQGAGAVVGGIVSATLVTRAGEGRAGALGMALLALGTVAFTTQSLVLAGVGMIVMGLGIPLTVVAFVTLRQRMTPDDLQGRTAAAGNIAFSLPQTVFSVVGAGVLAIVDYRILVWVTIGAAVVGAIVCFAARPAVAAARPAEPASD